MSVTCKHVWQIARPRYRYYDGWGYGYWIIDWYCEKCRKVEKRVES